MLHTRATNLYEVQPYYTAFDASSESRHQWRVSYFQRFNSARTHRCLVNQKIYRVHPPPVLGYAVSVVDGKPDTYKVSYIDKSRLDGDLILQNGLTGETCRCKHNQKNVLRNSRPSWE
jgi:hypothetical protein